MICWEICSQTASNSFNQSVGNVVSSQNNVIQREINDHASKELVMDNMLLLHSSGRCLRYRRATVSHNTTANVKQAKHEASSQEPLNEMKAG